jgi:AcrR family transcriptional regulator
MEPSPARKPGRPRSKQARVAILKAARELLQEGGLPAVTMEAIAQRAGVGKPTIYRTWANRYEVAMAALVDAAPAVTRSGRKASPLEALRHQLRQIAALFDSALGRGVASMLTAADAESEVARAFRNRFITARRDEGRVLLNAAVLMGDLRGQFDPEIALDLIYGPLFYRLLMGHGGMGEAYADAIVDCLVDGLGGLPKR